MFVNQSALRKISGAGGSEVGDIRPFAVAPGSPWIPADGSVQLQATYPAAYAKIGHAHYDWIKGKKHGTLATQGTAFASNEQAYGPPAYGNGIVLIVTGNSSIGIRARRSTDNGATFGAVVSIGAAGRSASPPVFLNGYFYCSIYYSYDDTGSLQRSADGITWTTVSGPLTRTQTYLAKAGNYLFAGPGGTTYQRWDGTTWAYFQTPTSLPASPFSLWDWQYGSAELEHSPAGVMLATNNTTTYYRSPSWGDSLSWVSQNLPVTAQTSGYTRFFYSNGFWYLATMTATNIPRRFVSETGLTGSWTEIGPSEAHYYAATATDWKRVSSRLWYHYANLGTGSYDILPIMRNGLNVRLRRLGSENYGATQYVNDIGDGKAISLPYNGTGFTRALLLEDDVNRATQFRLPDVPGAYLKAA